jgi:hypothetical protein
MRTRKIDPVPKILSLQGESKMNEPGEPASIYLDQPDGPIMEIEGELPVHRTHQTIFDLATSVLQTLGVTELTISHAGIHIVITKK